MTQNNKKSKFQVTHLPDGGKYRIREIKPDGKTRILEGEEFQCWTMYGIIGIETDLNLGKKQAPKD